MLGLGVALTIVGLIFLFVIPWLGIPAVAAGLVLTGTWFAGAGSRGRRWRAAR